MQLAAQPLGDMPLSALIGPFSRVTTGFLQADLGLPQHQTRAGEVQQFELHVTARFFHFGLNLRVVHNHSDISAAVTMSAPPQYSPQPSAAPQLYEHVLRKKYRSQVKLQQSLDCMFGEGTWEVKADSKIAIDNLAK
ncbi:uncharacterized protein PG998_004215 [Apiospora kogelbergensis]|uniref:uncharacterized protein n=1 Tax=Apiospora kogelbergensis TaxID=1337665 RepID=UPI00313025EA